MYFKDREETKAFCDDRDGKGGCGNADFVLPKDEFKEQFCSQCGKKTTICRWEEGTKITCPNEHDMINSNHKHCVVCGQKLIIKSVNRMYPVNKK